MPLPLAQPLAASRGQTDRLPNLIVIGAQKCATTTLHDFLGQHPGIHMSREKELNFFGEDTTWGQGLDWYRSHFCSGVR